MLDFSSEKEALRELTVATQLLPTRYRAYAAMARCFEGKFDWSPADTAWQKAIEGDGKVAEWHFRYGMVLTFMTGNEEGARSQFAKAIEAAAGSAPRWISQAHRQLAKLMDATDRPAAIHHYREYLRLAPPDDAYRNDVQCALQRLLAAEPTPTEAGH